MISQVFDEDRFHLIGNAVAFAVPAELNRLFFDRLAAETFKLNFIA
ncbi:hypothetical protein [uncultured Bradyrhizobium sp.]|nr:hypothetical protein [uncultured Bradyrhizobium sp.]